MKEGWEVIHGGYLKRGKWRGEFDFLIINRDLKPKFGDYSYEVIDTKNSNTHVPVDAWIAAGRDRRLSHAHRRGSGHSS